MASPEGNSPERLGRSGEAGLAAIAGGATFALAAADLLGAVIYFGMGRGIGDTAGLSFEVTPVSAEGFKSGRLLPGIRPGFLLRRNDFGDAVLAHVSKAVGRLHFECAVLETNDGADDFRTVFQVKFVAASCARTHEECDNEREDWQEEALIICPPHKPSISKGFRLNNRAAALDAPNGKPPVPAKLRRESRRFGLVSEGN